MAPDFTAIDNNGKQVHLSDFRGKVVLLNFWASWCGVCKTEKPELDKMSADLVGDDFVVIALASDRSGNIRAYFVNKRDWQSPVAETCIRSVIDED